MICFQPVSRYWDRINRPEQLLSAALQAMRVLSSPADTGAAVLARTSCQTGSFKLEFARVGSLNFAAGLLDTGQGDPVV